MDFVAIDVETANAEIGSICQVGLASYTDGKLVDEWASYINPETYFHPFNVHIHGINEHMVADSPLLPEIEDDIINRIRGRVVACHTGFDRAAVNRAFTRYSLSVPVCTWLDTARVARRAWNAFALRGYGLASVCSHIGYEFVHHDALEDAKAAGQILLAAMKETGLSVEEWLARAGRPINLPASNGPVQPKVRPEGPLFGEVVVFTGSLSMPRREAVRIAAEAGCEVANSVTSLTTMLIVGNQDVRKLAGHEKSAKLRKAEAFIEGGLMMRILREADFMELINSAE